MSDAPEYVIEVEDLTAGYVPGQLVLKGIDVRIARGQITCIIGGSGCGKSTFLRSLVGLLQPTTGVIRLLGRDITQLEDEERAAFLARVGFMFQYGALLNSISIKRNLQIPLRAHTQLAPEIIEEMIRMKLELVHLSHAVERLPGELSGGMRKRAGLARSIMLDPELLFCDEPSAGLDPITAADLDELLLTLKRLLNMTLVVVTHELSSIAVIADRIVMLQHGLVHFNGTLKDAMASDDPILRTFFDRKSEDIEREGHSVHQTLVGTPSEPPGAA